MFYNRVINFWNKIPDSVVLATSIFLHATLVRFYNECQIWTF